MRMMAGRRWGADAATRRPLLLALLPNGCCTHRCDLMLHRLHRLLALLELLLHLCSPTLVGGELMVIWLVPWRGWCIRRGVCGA